MNQALGQVVTGMIKKATKDGFLVQKDGVTYLLANSDIPADKTYTLGEMVEGFCYVNKHQTLKITPTIPKIRIGHFAWGEVVEKDRALGVYVNIGLPDKDIVISKDSLPTIKSLWPKAGDKVMISISIDNKDRMWGELADEKIFRSLARKANEQQQNQNISGTVFRLKLAGSYVLTDDFYLGYIHPSEREREPRLGEQITGRVIGVNEQGVLNLSLLPRNYEAIPEDAQVILDFLAKRQSKSMPYWDKSEPRDIESVFHMSKGRFKRALGHLMKAGLIEQEEGFVSLIEKGETEES